MVIMVATATEPMDILDADVLFSSEWDDEEPTVIDREIIMALDYREWELRHLLENVVKMKSDCADLFYICWVQGVSPTIQLLKKLQRLQRIELTIMNRLEA